MSTTRKKLWGRWCRKAIGRWRRSKRPGLVLYNTCSIRDKAEQKVFNRLSDYKKYKAQGKTFGVLGCVAQQEGEKIFERAPYVSLVAGSASYRKLPEMLRQLEAAELESAELEKVRRENAILEAGKPIPETESRKPEAW